MLKPAMCYECDCHVEKIIEICSNTKTIFAVQPIFP